MNKATRTKITNAIQRCNSYMQELWDLEDRNKTNAALCKRAEAALDKLRDYLCEDEEGEFDWTDDTIYELSCAIRDHEHRAGIKRVKQALKQHRIVHSGVAA